MKLFQQVRGTTRCVNHVWNIFKYFFIDGRITFTEYFWMIRFLSHQIFNWSNFYLIRFLSGQIFIWSDFYLNPAEGSSELLLRFTWQMKSLLYPAESNSKCSGSTIQIPWHWNPRMKNCSKYSISTVHSNMKLEPPIHRTASKVCSFRIFILNFEYIIISLNLIFLTLIGSQVIFNKSFSV